MKILDKSMLVEKALRQDIRRGRYASGAALPSEPALAKRYGVCRATVRKALDGIVRGGMLERRQGSGTFVRDTPRNEIAVLVSAESLNV